MSNFPSSTESDELAATIRDEIAQTGPMTFARFMALALYHPALGYYSGGGQGREPSGWEGDYFTSGDLHPLWGWCIARQLHQVWELLDRPQRFDVVELGAGRGLLAHEVWRYALERAPEWVSSLTYTLIDRAPAESPLRLAREARLAGELRALGAPEHATRWATDLDEAFPEGGIVGCIVSNELADALPVHVVEKQGNTLVEVYVDFDTATGRLVERLGPPSSPAVASYLDTFDLPWRTYPDSWRAELCLESSGWMRRAAAGIHRGVVLTVDYGDTARRLYGPLRRHGTLAAYVRHQLGEDLLAHPGQQDLTAHVNFSALIQAGREAGLRFVALTTQAAFLEHLGIREEAEALTARLYPYAITERHTSRGQLDFLRTYSLRNAVATLLLPGGLGGFKVLVQQRGMPGVRRKLRGLG
ncbi:MAG TPA: SAM-dependent methyltransferase [Ktedonobacterales bacterium]|nr:SAM-dependent methyltransferase [Ktedonobacterales bacterium]